MLVIVVLWISVSIQFVSVYFALRLIKEIGGKLAWVTLSAAIFLMAIRRSISLYHTMHAYPNVTQDLYTEIVALTISVCILVGVISIGPLFKRLISSENKLTEQMRRNQMFINTTPDAFMLADINGKIHEVNHSFYKLFNITHLEVLNSFSELLSPSEHKKFSQAWETLLNDKKNRFVFHYYFNQEMLSLEMNAALIDVDSGSLIYAFIQDVTEQEKMEAKLFKQKERAQVTLESITDGVITTDKKGVINFLNSSAENLLGRDGVVIVGEKLKNILCSDCGQFELNNQPLHKLVIECIKQQKTLSFPNQIIKNASGVKNYFDVIISLLKNKDNIITGTVLVLRDVTALRRMEEALSYQSTHDPLTNLINRYGFEKKLADLFDDVAKNNSQHAVLNIRLDATQFQLITDSCGQDAKEKLLKNISMRLEHIVGKKDCVTCVDHTDFRIIVESVEVNSAQRKAKHVISTFIEDNFEWQSTLYELNVSVGIAMLTRKTQNVTDILSYASSACYVAEQNGKNQLHVYSDRDENSTRQHSQRLRLHQLQRAIDEERFVLFKQTICNLQDDSQKNHCEILIRMTGDNGEIISPIKFLPVAEQYHLMPMIDRWVVKEIFFLIMNSTSTSLSESHCSINLSGQTLGDESFLDEVLVLFKETKIPYSKICFEITETAVISNFKFARKFISTLRARGCKFSLDDFGSGLSSFGYLKDLPVDYLKIDGSFVLDILTDQRDYNLVKSIHQIGKLMGIKTVAEFIESKDMAECVKKMGIDYGQGYALGKPKPIKDMINAA